MGRAGGTTEAAGDVEVVKGEPVDGDLEALRARIYKLASTTLAELEKDLRYGSPAQRNHAIKVIAPYLLKALSPDDEADDGLGELRGAMEELRKQLVGGD